MRGNESLIGSGYRPRPSRFVIAPGTVVTRELLRNSADPGGHPPDRQQQNKGFGLVAVGRGPPAALGAGGLAGRHR